MIENRKNLGQFVKNLIVSISTTILIFQFVTQKCHAAEITPAGQTPGKSALEGNVNYLNSNSTAFYHDGYFENSGTDTKQLDTRFGGAETIEATKSFSGKFNLRISAEGNYTQRKKIDLSDSEKYLQEKKSQFGASVTGLFFIQNSMELSLGMTYAQLPQWKSNKHISSGTSTTTYKGTSLATYRIAFVKRVGNGLAAGAWYQFQGQSKRTSETPNSPQGTSEDVAFIPASFGGFIGHNWGDAARANLEAIFVAANKADEQTDEGHKLNRDYYKLVTNADYSPTSGIILELLFRYRTLSYNDQGYMNFENIPSTSAGLGAYAGNRNSHIYIGYDFSIASDSQTTPELNAKYSLYAHLLKLGLRLPI